MKHLPSSNGHRGCKITMLHLQASSWVTTKQVLHISWIFRGDYKHWTQDPRTWGLCCTGAVVIVKVQLYSQNLPMLQAQTHGYVLYIVVCTLLVTNDAILWVLWSTKARDSTTLRLLCTWPLTPGLPCIYALLVTLINWGDCFCEWRKNEGR